VLTFIDTDNYTPARAAIEVARERTVPGGAIVFDHFTGTSRFRYTLGERIAGRVLLDDPRWFHLHGNRRLLPPGDQPVKRPPVPRPRIYDLYWYFASERQRMFERRVAGEPGPWTGDRILREYKFCNVFRASDRGRCTRRRSTRSRSSPGWQRPAWHRVILPICSGALPEVTTTGRLRRVAPGRRSPGR